VVGRVATGTVGPGCLTGPAYENDDRGGGDDRWTCSAATMRSTSCSAGTPPGSCCAPAGNPFAARTVVVVENEVSYLAFPRVPGAAVVLGGGYAVSRLAALPWLPDRDVVYWGDVDTHGFRALDRLRRFAPAARSMLMELPTLLAHHAHWSQEPVPVTEHLALLTTAEQACYQALLRGEHGDRVRLEQERIRFSAVERAVDEVFPPG